jgi:hypothetical protein
MAHLFISYSKQNIEFARHLRGLLQASGFDVWMDEARLSASIQWADTIEASITGASAFVIVMSPEAKESQWVARELLLAQRLRKPIFPILYEGEVWWNLADIQYEDMRGGVQSALPQRMIDALRQSVGASGAASDAGASHLPPAPQVSQNDTRRLEAAMPAETRAGTETEVWAKVSLPNSEGLRGELPAVVPSGDVIQKSDARATGFPIRFPTDPRTGKRLPAQAQLRVAAGDFEIAPGERADVEIPPDSDSRTVIFTLEPKPGGRTGGRARVFIDLIFEAKVIAQISVSTVLVEQVTAAVPSWNLAAPGYFAPDAVMRGMAPLSPMMSAEFPAAAPADAPIDDLLLPAAPQPLVSAPRSTGAPEFAPAAKSRRATGTTSLVRAVSAVAALALVAVVALSVTRLGGGILPPATDSSLTFSEATAFAADFTDIAVAPMIDCAGAPGANLVKILNGGGFQAALLDHGITAEADARALSGYRVVAWGACSGGTLALTLELNRTEPRQGISDPRALTFQWASDALGQDGSLPVRLVRAVTDYARSGTGADYAALAQTFDELASQIAQEPARTALRTLGNNSRFYAAQSS